MSGLPPELAALSTEEKMALSRLLIESIPADELPLTDAQMADLQMRIAEDRLDPDEGVLWEDIKAEYETRP